MLAIALIPLLAAAPADAADPAPVVAAERAFAADGAASGVKASFLKWMADDAVVLAPDPVNARAFYGKAPEGPRRHVLTWRPTYAGLAEGGDLGFTTGPYAIDGKPGGHYFTVWARQADGSWKWIFDSGVEDDASTAPPPDQPVRAMAPAAPARVRSDEAAIDVGAAESALSAASFGHSLAPDARLQGSAAAPAHDAGAVKAERSRRPADIAFSQLAVRSAKDGDLVFTYGDARWAEAGKPRRGHYARLWRHDRAGYRIVFDELIPVPEETK